MFPLLCPSTLSQTPSQSKTFPSDHPAKSTQLGISFLSARTDSARQRAGGPVQTLALLHIQ
jgi:hypothetical protein